MEINSSFYRPHQAKTYARWAASVPDAFRFCVKIPRAITHELRLRDADAAMAAFVEQAAALGGAHTTAFTCAIPARRPCMTALLTSCA